MFEWMVYRFVLLVESTSSVEGVSVSRSPSVSDRTLIIV